MISSTIWNKKARVNFPKTNKSARASECTLLVFEKFTMKEVICLFVFADPVHVIRPLVYALHLSPTDFSKPPEPTHSNFSPPQSIFIPPSSYYQCLMSVFTSDIEEAKLCVQIFRPFI